MESSDEQNANGFAGVQALSVFRQYEKAVGVGHGYKVAGALPLNAANSG
jgi:hypothetical protein